MTSFALLRGMNPIGRRHAPLCTPLFLMLLLIAGCTGDASNSESVKEQTRGTTNSPQAHKTGPSTDPGIPGMNLADGPRGYTQGGGSQVHLQSIDVLLADGRITMPQSVRAGHLTLNVVNNGSTAQTFAIDAENMKVTSPTALDAGKSTTLTADLLPGRYKVHTSADVNGESRAAEMELVVTE